MAAAPVLLQARLRLGQRQRHLHGRRFGRPTHLLLDRGDPTEEFRRFGRPALPVVEAGQQHERVEDHRVVLAPLGRLAVQGFAQQSLPGLLVAELQRDVPEGRHRRQRLRVGCAVGGALDGHRFGQERFGPGELPAHGVLPAELGGHPGDVRVGRPQGPAGRGQGLGHQDVAAVPGRGRPVVAPAGLEPGGPHDQVLGAVHRLGRPGDLVEDLGRGHRLRPVDQCPPEVQPAVERPLVGRPDRSIEEYDR